MTAQLEKIRSEVDRIDKDIVRLLAERMAAIREIGAYKRDNKEAPILDAPRERRVADLWAREARARDLSPYFASRILREILTWSRRDQSAALDRHEVPATKRCRVAFQGTSGSYSDLAIKKLFAVRKPDEDVTRLGRRTFKAALAAVLEGEADYALLPVENTIAGTINEVYALLADNPVSIVDEEAWEVEHILAGLPGASLDDIRTVRSQAVALQQCRKFLDDLGCVVEASVDTATAAHDLKAEGDPSVAAICSEEAARDLGLDVVARGIADSNRNLTRFVLLSREAETFDERVPARTSLVLSLNHRQGALAACLQSLSDRGCNLTKLESRPQPDAPWEYLFYVDAEGRAESGPLAEALREIQPLTNRLQVLGTYPRRVGLAVESPMVSAEPKAPARETPPDPSKVPACAPDPQLKHVARKGGERTIVRVGPVAFGSSRFALIAGPCAVESKAQILDAAAMVQEAGAAMLRGGAFKPRTSPYAFQGLGQPGVEILADAGRAYELPVVTEVVRPEDVDGVAARADMLQVGARNMQNFGLLSKLGTVDRPILLKRGMSATIKELLLAAEYIMAGGNRRVVLCERGIRTFETATRNTLDVSAVPVLKDRTHLPVIVDPSHAAGRRDLVIPLALAAAAVGADGLIVECHPRPEEARCDKEQALTPDDLQRLTASLRPILEARGRHLEAEPVLPEGDDGGPCFHGC